MGLSYFGATCCVVLFIATCCVVLFIATCCVVPFIVSVKIFMLSLSLSLSLSLRSTTKAAAHHRSTTYHQNVVWFASPTLNQATKKNQTFSFKSWPPYEKNLAPPLIHSHKNAPTQILTCHLFDISFHSLRHVGHIPHFFSWVRLCPIAIQSPMLYWCGNYH